VNMIESLLPGGFGLGGQSSFLFSSLQEQASSLLFILKIKLRKC
jgi:hypothetical protein